MKNVEKNIIIVYNEIGFKYNKYIKSIIYINKYRG